MDSGKPYDEAKLKALIRDGISDASGAWTNTVAEASEQNLRDYFGEPYGDERDGRSQVVHRTAFEVIEWAHADMMEMFTGGLEVARVEPVGPEDEAQAQQRSALLNHVFLNENDGERVLHDAIKDALMVRRGGWLKAYVEEVEEISEETYTGLDEMQLAQVAGDGAQIVAAEARTEIVTDGMGAQAQVTLYDVTVRRVNRERRIRSAAVAPEDVGVASEVSDVNDAVFAFHRVRTTRTALKEQGYPAELVDRIAPDESWVTSGEREARAAQEDGGLTVRDGIGSAQTDRVTVYECYLRHDCDGDGKAELVRVLAGDSQASVILDAPSPCEFIPLSHLTPIIVPHRLYGMSLADAVEDLQRVETTVWRQYLDALYLANNPRSAVLEGQADLDELLASVPGGYVTVKRPDAIMPLPQMDASATALPALEMLRGTRENRIGITRYNQGTDARDSLNKTATGINLIQAAAAKRIVQMARCIALGVRDHFRKLDALVTKYTDKPKVVRMRGQFVNVDPTEWRTGADATLAVALGTGNREGKISAVQGIMMVQQQMAEAGMGGVLVTPANVYHAAAKLVEALGFKSAAPFFTDPEGPEAQPQEPPPPDPKMVEIESRERIEAQKLALDAERLRMDHEFRMADLNLKAAKAMTPEAA